MANTPPPISVYRLHRMLPSDLEKLKTTVSNIKGAFSVFELFGEYLLALKKPTAVELDDVARVTLQLNSIGLWNVLRPELFVQQFGSSLHRDVLETFRAVLNLELPSPPGDNDAPKADQSPALPVRGKVSTGVIHGTSGDVSFLIGPYTFRPISKLLINPTGNVVHLTEREAAILRVLSEAKKPVSREVLSQKVSVSAQTLDLWVKKLRKRVRKGGAKMGIVLEAGSYRLVS
jgi:hypothetical protein